MSTLVRVIEPVEIIPAEAPGRPQDRSGARGDEDLVELWVRRKGSPQTRRAYRREGGLFLAFLASVGASLGSATVRDVQDWADALEGKPATRARHVSAIRSLLRFAHRTGYIPFNVGEVVDVPKTPNDLAERVLSEVDVARLFEAAEGQFLALLRLFYYSGARLSEATGLCWRHVHEGPNGTCTLTVHGKGGKTRHVLLPPVAAQQLLGLRADAGPDEYVFRTRSGRPLHPSNVQKTLTNLRKKAGIAKAVSPHWLRHACASHALARGANVAVVRDTLGHANLATTSKYLHARPGDSAGLYLPTDL